MRIIVKILKWLVPASLRSGFIRWLYRPKPRRIRWGNLRRLSPVSRVFGADRGQSIDRYYIEAFLDQHREDIHGTVLEIGDPAYTLKYGDDRVVLSEVLHAQAGNDKATIVGDLSTGEGIAENRYDCMILTQTFPFIYNLADAISHCHKALGSGGVVLATFPGISQISRYDMDRWGDFWRFTNLSCTKLFADVFGEGNVSVVTHGNVLTSCAFLHGIAAHELSKEELGHVDEDYQMLITVRAQKS